MKGIENMEKGKLLIISGPSGSGKSYIAEKLRDNYGFYLSVSYATRKPRPGEIDGISYRFITPERFDELVKDGELLEYATYTSGKYGTPRKNVEEALSEGRNVILEIDINGARQVIKTYSDVILFMLAPPNNTVLRRRLRGRRDTPEDEMARRLQIAHDELAGLGEYDYIIINYDNESEKAMNEINDIIVNNIPHPECEVKNNADFMEKFFAEDE